MVFEYYKSVYNKKVNTFSIVNTFSKSERQNEIVMVNTYIPYIHTFSISSLSFIFQRYLLSKRYLLW